MQKVITKRPNGSRRVVTVNDKPSKTDQQYRDDCDVNHIMNKYAKTGIITHLAKHPGRFANVSEIPNLLEGFEKVNQAKQAFMDLPGSLRKRFNNDFRNMVAFLNDRSNQEEAIKLGLIELKEIAEQADSPVDAPTKSTKKSTKGAKGDGDGLSDT
jgi:hypothetical protein